MMKIYSLAFALLMGTSLVANAQNESIDKHADGQPFVVVEQMPSFPGGEQKLQKFIRKNFVFPQQYKDTGEYGRVVVRFVVGSTGELRDFEIVQGYESPLDEEALRVVKSMPHWIPGLQNGRAVPTYFTLPVVTSSSEKRTINKVTELYNEGNEFFHIGKYRDAIEYYKKAIELDPNYISAYCNWGAALNELGRYEETIEKYQKAATINPDKLSVQGYSNWGAALGHLNRGEEAMPKFEKAVEINPNMMYVYYNWGIVYNIMEKYDEAVVKFEKAATIAPTHGDPYYRWGIGLQLLGKYDEASDKLTKAIKYKTSYTEDAYFNKAWILQEQGRYEEAILGFTNIIELMPNNAKAYYAWGYCLAALNRKKEAIEKYKKAIEIVPGHSNSYLAWGKILEDEGKHKQAEKLYLKRGQVEDRKNPQIIHRRAINKFKKSVRIFGTRINFVADNVEAYSDWHEKLEELKKKNPKVYYLVTDDFERVLTRNKMHPGLIDDKEFGQIYRVYFPYGL